MNLHRLVLRCSLLSLSLCAFHPDFLSGQVRPRVVQAVDDAKRVTLPGNVHPLARAEFDRGAVAESQPMNRILLLLQRSDAQETALQTMLQSQLDKSSANYHQWLTPEQFGAQFGAADADVQAVTDWLTRQGFSVGKVYSGKTVIEFSGTAGQVQRAFGAPIHNYQINGKTYSANASDPQIPAALAPVVAGVVSLHNFPRQFYARRVGSMHRAAGKNVFEPSTTFPNPFGSGSFYGMGPGDFAKIYNTPATCGTPAAACTGSGQTIAIVGETNINVSDVQQFRSVFGLPATFDANSIVYNGEDPGITSTDEEGEADLDTEWSGAVAPGAAVKYVLSASTSASQGVDLSALYIVEHNLAGTMSESYGACESNLGSTENSFENNLWEQASAQGITVAVSSGDSGSAGCDDPNTKNLATQGTAVNGLASTPYNVAVGGTDFDEYNNWTTYWSATNNATTGASALGYIPEIPWNQSCAQVGISGCNPNTPPELQNIVAGGGGPSAKYSKPSWQMGITGVPNDSKRDLPDISLLASPGFNGTGYLYCQTDIPGQGCSANFTANFVNIGVIGGTSASAPAFAGVMALVNQSQSTPQNAAPRQGNANYILYALANKSGTSCTSSASEAAGCVFNDITKGSSALPTGGKGVGTNSVPCRAVAIECSATVAGQYGVLATASGSTTEAWTSGTGYDMATGLGSLNIANLTTSWGNVSSVATSTTLALTPTTGITHGSESVSATISVTPQSGTAKGTVSLLAKLADGSTVGAGAFTLGSGGSVTGTTQSLPGGTNYQVFAHYSGDGTNAPSDSNSVQVTVNPESSQLFVVVPLFDGAGNQLSGNASSMVYGEHYIVRMYVTDKNGLASPNGPPSGTCDTQNILACPSGAVTLTANGTPLDGGTFTLNNVGYTRDLASSLQGGSYTLTAAYSGDASYQAPSSPTSVSFTVTPAATSQQWFVFQSSAIVGQAINIGVVIDTGVAGVAPTGTVTFYDGSSALATATTYSPQGVGNNVVLYASGPVTLNTGGQHGITAKYSGDANYQASVSSPITVTALYPTALRVTESATNINFGQSVMLTAKVTSSNKTPALSGQIQFFGNTAIPGPVTTTLGTDGSGNQVLTGTVTTTPQFTEEISANYGNDPNYEAGSAFGDVVVVNIPDFSIPNGSELEISAGQTQTMSLQVTPLSNTPSTVNVSLASGQPPPGFTIGLAPASVSLNGSPVPVTLTVTTAGAGAAPAIAHAIRKASIGDVSRGSWLVAAGMFAVLAVYLAGIPGKRRRYRLAFFTAGLFVLSAGMGCGGGGGGGGGGGTQSPTSITLASSSPKVALGASFTLTATITASKPLTGTVSVLQNGQPWLSGLELTGNQATVVVPNNGLPMIATYTASYGGDAQNQGSVSATGVTEVYQGTLPVVIQGQTGGLTRNATVNVVLK